LAYTKRRHVYIPDKPILRTWMQRGKTGENRKARPAKNVEIVG
jgi:hypothetical protein